MYLMSELTSSPTCHGDWNKEHLPDYHCVLLKLLASAANIRYEHVVSI